MYVPFNDHIFYRFLGNMPNFIYLRSCGRRLNDPVIFLNPNESEEYWNSKKILNTNEFILALLHGEKSSIADNNVFMRYFITFL